MPAGSRPACRPSRRRPSTASVSYVDGVTGGNVFVMPLNGARALAAAMMGEEPPEDEADDLTELELSAVGEAMNQMMAAAANATSGVLGTEVEIAPPDTRVLTSLDRALEGHDDAAHVTSGVFTVFGQPCRLVQLVPNAFVDAHDQGARRARRRVPRRPGSDRCRRLRRASTSPCARSRCACGPSSAAGACRSASLVGTPAGAVVELDREADEPVDLFVNGMRFASGRLVVSEGGEWAVEIDSLVGGETAAAA